MGLPGGGGFTEENDSFSVTNPPPGFIILRLRDFRDRFRTTRKKQSISRAIKLKLALPVMGIRRRSSNFEVFRSHK